MTLTELREQLLQIATGDTPLGEVVVGRGEAAALVAEIDELDDEDSDEFEGWADVEIMGHRRRIAYVRPIELARRGFLELTSRRLGVDQVELYTPAAVFCLVPLADEQAARDLQAEIDGTFAVRGGV